MVDAVGVGAAPVGHVLADLLHVDPGCGDAAVGVDAQHRVEQHELEEREALDLAGNELAVLGRAGELELRVAHVHHYRAVGPH